MHVLIVEHGPDIGEVIRDLLVDEGHSGELAATAVEALAAVKRQAPDVVIVDLMLPDVDGVSVGQLLHRSQALRDVPIVVLSGYRSVDAPDDLGTPYVLQKPFDLADLLRMLATATAGRGS